MQVQYLALFVLSLLAVPSLSESLDFYGLLQALEHRGFAVDGYQHDPNYNVSCSCSDACSILTLHYGEKYVLTPNETAYTTFRNAYWSTIQSDPRPHCIFQPPNVDAISALVLLSQLTQCPFALKSGGHSAFAGAASIQGGITVSFEHLNEITLSEDKKVAFVQPGNDWAQVYAKLAENNLTAVGGRVERIGVGGLTLGGGISFFSGFHGWACDNVEAYEVVMSSGNVISVTSTEYPDLYWALRGGGNNFGIVTRFHLRTIPIPGNIIWAGARTYTAGQFPRVVDAFSNLGLNAISDPRAGYWAAFGTINSTKFSSVTLWYSDPQTINNTNIFDEINSVNSTTDSTGPRNLVQFVTENQVGNPYGFREVYWAWSIKVSAELANFAIQVFYDDIPMISGLPGSFGVLLFQTITVPQMVSMRQNGGNPLGLDPEGGPVFLMSMNVWWNNSNDDSKAYTFVSGVQRKVVTKAREMNLENDYIYMNYASQFQDVIRSYGAANKARLIQIAKKYDPNGVFQVLQPGHFKLGRPPTVSDYFTGNWS